MKLLMHPTSFWRYDVVLECFVGALGPSPATFGGGSLPRGTPMKGDDDGVGLAPPTSPSTIRPRFVPLVYRLSLLVVFVFFLWASMVTGHGGG
jgi:hypothetical protein